MIEKLNEIIESYRGDIIAKTQRLLAFNSVYEESDVPGQPFGPHIAAALEDALQIASELGFSTRNVEGYMGEVDFGSAGKKIGVVAHIDIVPAGDGWTYPPFAGEIVEGKLYGRGSIDDKGPLVAALYAMKAIKESGLPCTNHARLLIGCDEESGFRCIKYYLTKEQQPWGGFSPDGEFPVIYGEKGTYRFKCTGNWKEEAGADSFVLVEARGGSRMNVVPEAAYAKLNGSKHLHTLAEQALGQYPQKESITLSYEGDSLIVQAQGIGAHAATPWQGANANNILLNYLAMLPIAPLAAQNYVRSLARLFGDGHEGVALGIATSNEEFGKLTVSMGILDIDAQGGSASFDLRYPNLPQREQLWAKISAACQAEGVELTLLQDKPGLHVPKDSPLIKSLLQAYHEATGRDEQPITIGGGTYCRALENFVAYGPLFPGQKELAHERDEFIGVEDLILCAKIYGQALYALLR